MFSSNVIVCIDLVDTTKFELWVVSGVRPSVAVKYKWIGDVFSVGDIANITQGCELGVVCP